MNYVSIVLLIMVIFLLLPNKRIYKRDKIEKIYGKNISTEIEKVRGNIVYINTKELEDIFSIERNISNYSNKYIIVCKEQPLNQNVLEMIISNFVSTGMETSGFNYKFIYSLEKLNLRNFIRKIFVVCINYIAILARNNYNSFDIIISKSENFVEDIKNKKIIKFSASDELIKEVLKFNEFKNKYIKKVFSKKYKVDIENALSIMLVTIAGTIITANIFFVILNPIDNIWNIIVCLVTYICYSNIISQIYNPIGKFRLVATYIFPIYIVVYFLYTAYYFIRREREN
ncbi:MAG: hypothetical protein IKV94_04140 [Clostridia bacterium]|nr:hypothetical protein [Clostridia bacterium]